MKAAELFRLVEMTMRLFLEKESVFCLANSSFHRAENLSPGTNEERKRGGERKGLWHEGRCHHSAAAAAVAAAASHRLPYKNGTKSRIWNFVFENGKWRRGDSYAKWSGEKKRNWGRFWQISACLVNGFFFRGFPSFLPEIVKAPDCIFC